MILSKLHPIIGSLMLMSLLSVELENASAQTASSEQRLRNPLAPFTELLGGKWIADEKQITAEGRGFYPQITYESWFDSQVIVATMHHLFDDGEEELKWKAFNVWHPQKEKIAHYGFWSNGMLIEGEFAEIIDGEPIELNFNVYWPSGSSSDLPTKWRSFGRRIDANTHTEEAYFYRDGEWVPNITLTYRRNPNTRN